MLELVKGRFDGEDVGFDFGDLFEGAGESDGGGLAEAGGGVVAMEHAVEELGVFAEECVVGLGHEVVAAALVVGIGGEVGVEAFGDFAEEGAEVEADGFGSWFGGGDVLEGFAKVGFAEEALGVVDGFGGDFELGDAGLPFVELDVEDADLADVAGLKAVELGAEGGEGGLAVGEGAAEGGEFGAAVGELGVFRGGAAEDGVAVGHCWFDDIAKVVEWLSG
jgi:hypothetical protein